MTIEQYNKAESLRKQIASLTAKIDRFKMFQKHPNISEVRLNTPQDCTLIHVLERDELDSFIEFLEVKYNHRLAKLVEEFENL